MPGGRDEQAWAAETDAFVAARQVWPSAEERAAQRLALVAQLRADVAVGALPNVEFAVTLIRGTLPTHNELRSALREICGEDVDLTE